MYIFVINPHARSGLGGAVWQQIETVLQEREIPYQAYITGYQRHATKLIREITSDGEEHTIVILGGDGTVNEVLNGIEDLSKITLGYIPIGSSNDFARYFKHSPDPMQALETILSPGKYVEMDVGIMTYRDGVKRKRFAVSTGMGFDAAVCHQAVISKLKVFLNKLHLGKLTYVGIAISRIIHMEPDQIRIRLDEGEEMVFERAFFATAMNHPYEGGGFKFCPEADPCDSRINVTVIYGLPKLKVLLLLPLAFKGWHTRFRGVYVGSCERVSFESDRALPIHTDGEPVFLQRKMTAALEKDKVRLIVG